jgi:hypothetical protein
MSKIESRENEPKDKKAGVLTNEEKRHLKDSMHHNDKLMRQLAHM